MKVLLITIMSTVFVVARSASNNCINEALSECQPVKLELGEYYYENMPDIEYFEESCERLVDNAKCFFLESKQCHTLEREALLNSVQLGVNLCDSESLIGKAYRENVECIRNNSEELRNCEDKAAELSEYFKQELLNVGKRSRLNERENLERACLRADFKLKCESKVLERNCGLAAMVVVHDINKETYNNYEMLCIGEVQASLQRKFNKSLLELVGHQE